MPLWEPLYWQDGGDYLLIVCSFAWRKCQYRRNFAGRWTLRWSFMFFRDSRRPRSFPYFVAHRMKLLHLHTLAKVSATLSSPLIMRCDLENALQVTTPPFRTQSESDRLVCKGKWSPASNWKQKQIGYLFWPSIWSSNEQLVLLIVFDAHNFMLDTPGHRLPIVCTLSSMFNCHLLDRPSMVRCAFWVLKMRHKCAYIRMIWIFIRLPCRSPRCSANRRG